MFSTLPQTIGLFPICCNWSSFQAGEFED